MVAKLLVLAGLFAVVLAVFVLAAFRYIDRQADRQHERKMAREERDYETIMEYAETEAREHRESAADPTDPDRERDRE